ncbi:mucolipin-3 isoform X1 [Boleophthalmus pectinirostris]|uniref:mucolipin-3 isoform X1 n=1 Tax=Boleophthalmus pectinirostris TaxID=150288 RepID=UPI00242BFD92|nr:mucolipin-3 isoform X1 [Boleophthalmus pectinirostris]
MEESEPLVPRRSGLERTQYGWSGHIRSLESHMVEDFRRKLKYFFMNPCEKYKARGRKPWKLLIQVFKIVIITVQLVSFGLSNEMMVTFKDESLLTFKHLFLKGFKDHQMQTYAIYTKADLYNHIYFVTDRYLHLQNLTMGNLAYAVVDGRTTPLSLCKVFYRNSSVDPSNETFNIDPHIERECINVYPMGSVDTSLGTRTNFSLDFRRLLSVNIYLTLKSINLQTVRHHELPDCYDFKIQIIFDNSAHSGMVKVDVKNNVSIYECKDWRVEGTSGKNNYGLLVFDSVVILACFASLILCLRSVINGIQLQFEFNIFFHAYFNKIVSWSDRMEFINGWYILIIISDILTIIGSVTKIGIQTKFLTNYDVCSILLGTATMLVWVGVIRYFGFFKKYNILILTLRAAFPNVIRFCCCAAMIYLGYCFCGWIILGPHHDKFRTLDKVTECLFSLINGDDMYATFLNLRDKSYMVWLFSRLYLYSFISLFIYMVLSLFIALITDTYETIKHHQQEKVPASELQAFIAECRDQPESGRYQTNKSSSCCCSG